MTDFFSWFGASAGGGQSTGIVNPSQPIVTRDQKGDATLPTGATNSPADQTARNDQLLSEVEINKRPKKEVTYAKSQLGILKFPLDIEQSPVPHVLIKIFETETGAVERTDSSTQSFVEGSTIAAQGIEKNNLVEVAAAVVGGKAALGPAALALLARRPGLAAAIVGGAATVGAVAVSSGALGALAGKTADVAGQLALGVEDTSSRFTKAISNFALKRNIQQLRLGIALLMPETLAVSYNNSYEQISLTGETGTPGMIAQALGSTLGGTGDAADPYIVEAAGRLAQNLVSENFRKIGLFATTGRTINPQPEMIYTSPTLREFTMDFRLVPRNIVEADAIKALIYNLKFFSAPQIPKDTGGRYFIPPAQFELEFYDANNNQNEFLFKTKKCVLQDVSVDYSGAGSFATFYNGAPVETRLSLRFTETVFIDREAVVGGY